MNVITGQERREKSNQKIKKLGIACLEQLPCLPDSEHIHLRGKEEIAKRAIACLLISNVAVDIYNKNDIEESKEFFGKLLKQYSVDTSLTPDEKKVFEEELTEQEACDLQWRLEGVEVLFWILGLIPELSFPEQLVNTIKLNNILQSVNNLEEFMSKVKMIDVEKILDETDLEYRYHWACVEKRINPATEIKNLYPDVVYERRRALEWVINDHNDDENSRDWDTISLDT